MHWVLLALAAATAKAGHSLITKVLLRGHGALWLACVSQMAAGLLAAPLILIPGAVSVPADPGFHGWAAFTIVGNVLAAWLLNLAILRSDLSYALPFLALTPPFTLVTGYLLRGESGTGWGILGVLIAALGAFAVGAQGLADWIRGGGIRVFRDRGVQLTVGVAGIYALTSVADKQVALAGGPITFLWYGALGRGAVFTLIWLALRGRWRGDGSSPMTGRDGLWLAALVLLMAAEHLAHLYALTMGLVAYVLTIKRLSVLETSLGGWWFFREPVTRFRWVGAALLMAGAALVYVG